MSDVSFGPPPDAQYFRDAANSSDGLGSPEMRKPTNDGPGGPGGGATAQTHSDKIDHRHADSQSIPDPTNGSPDEDPGSYGGPDPSRHDSHRAQDESVPSDESGRPQFLDRRRQEGPSDVGSDGGSRPSDGPEDSAPLHSHGDHEDASEPTQGSDGPPSPHGQRAERPSGDGQPGDGDGDGDLSQRFSAYMSKW
jgi:hypothetical protein